MTMCQPNGRDVLADRTTAVSASLWYVASTLKMFPGHVIEQERRRGFLRAALNALAAQRLPRRLHKRRVRRRRPRRVLTGLPQLPPQLDDLGLQARDPVNLRHDKSSKLLIGRDANRRAPHHQQLVA
jgi:hypothetical protein